MRYGRHDSRRAEFKRSDLEFGVKISDRSQIPASSAGRLGDILRESIKHRVRVMPPLYALSLAKNPASTSHKDMYTVEIGRQYSVTWLKKA
jgi:hypothetical protein